MQALIRIPGYGDDLAYHPGIQDVVQAIRSFPFDDKMVFALIGGWIFDSDGDGDDDLFQKGDVIIPALGRAYEEFNDTIPA